MKITPAPQETKQYFEKGYKRVPLTTEILADSLTPIEALRKLQNVSGHCFLLESAEVMSSPTLVCEFEDGKFHTYEIKPEDFGLTRCGKAELKGGDPETNAKLTRDILSGTKGPKRGAVLLNAGAGLYLCGKASSVKDGVTLAAELIDSGKALAKLDEFIKASNEVTA